MHRRIHSIQCLTIIWLATLSVPLTVQGVEKQGVEKQDVEKHAMEKTDLFRAGDHGYKLYHIPGIVVTAKGTVLAWCEARLNGGDWDQIDILLRRSTDDGRTWSDAKKIAHVPGPKKKNSFALRLNHTDPATVTYNNPVLIADRDGTVHMLFCLEYMRCFYQRSNDDGISWSEPVEITETFEAFRNFYDWKVLATGPNHGIQLRNGRLLVPVWLSTGTGGNAHRPSVSATIFSDDNGKTWQAGEIAVPCNDEFVNPSETIAIQLEDGSVMLNSRNESKPRRRIVVTSKDGATNWSEPRFQEDLVDPMCMAGLTRYRHGGEDFLLFTNPNVTRGRRNVSVRISEDEGRTWPIVRCIEFGFSAYSDIIVTPKGTILCFYGRSRKPHFAGDRLTLARFDREWLRTDPLAELRAKSVKRVAFVQESHPHSLRGQMNEKKTTGPLVLTGQQANVFASHDLLQGDFTIHARLSLDQLDGTAAGLIIGDNLFGFDGATTKNFFIEGSEFGNTRLLENAEPLIKSDEVFEVTVTRDGDTLTFIVNDKTIHSGQYQLPEPCMVGLRPWRATLRIHEFSASGSLIADES